jgi:hypothetical protein
MASRVLFSHLIDDAALFPPGNAAMPAAVRAHAEHEQSWYAHMVGPLLCTDARLAELAQAAAARPDRAGTLDVGVIVTQGPDAISAAVHTIAQDRHLHLAQLEIPADPGDPVGSIAAIEAAAGAAGVRGLPVYVEVPRGEDAEAAIAATAAAGMRAKLRTGGEHADAFPDESEVAAFIVHCLQHGTRFKCTAGLHEAVRHTAPDTGFEHHGFLNLMVAMRVALEGGDPTAIAAAIAERDEHEVVRHVMRLDDVAATAVRGWFSSYGSCSTIEPVAELVRLGLVADHR